MTGEMERLVRRHGLCLVTDHYDRLLSLDSVEGKFDGIGEHWNSQERMKDLHKVRLHPGPLSCCKNHSDDALQSSILFDRNSLFYTMSGVISQPCRMDMEWIGYVNSLQALEKIVNEEKCHAELASASDENKKVVRSSNKFRMSCFSI